MKKLLAIAGGELKQRLREPGFLILLVALAAGATYLAPSPGSAYSTLSLGNSGIFGGSGLAGTSSGMDFGVFAGFFGIFALSSGFARDDRTRLSELLRAQPISTLGLVLGRVLASWALGATLALGGMLLLGITLAFREGATFEPFVYARNFLLLAVPTTFAVASIAALLDVSIGKWRGLLIPVALFGYIFLLSWSTPALQSGPPHVLDFDFAGIRAVQSEFNLAHGSAAMLNGGIEAEDHPGKPIIWSGLVPTTDTLIERAVVVAEAAGIAFLAFLCYRRRAGTSIKGAQAIEPQRAGTYAFAAVTAPIARARGAIGRIASETLFRVRKNPLLACASLALLVLALFGAQKAHHWIVAGAILLPLFWIRVFDDALRPKSLDEALGSLKGGLAGDWIAKAATLSLLCVLPLLGLLIGNPGDPAVWLAATAGLVVEIAFLTTVVWVFRAELLGLGVVALWWYLIAFNAIPAPIDYAGLWSVSAVSMIADAILAIALVATAQTWLRRRT